AVLLDRRRGGAASRGRGRPLHPAPRAPRPELRARARRLRHGDRGDVPHGVADRMSASEVSRAAQDYLREIYKLQGEDGRVTTTAWAARLRVTARSASGMVKKLAAEGLVEHAPYKGVRLTAEGERIALEMLRHHRLLEVYLAQTLGLPIDAVHVEADRLEHALSEELESRIAEALGNPTHDPHGD